MSVHRIMGIETEYGISAPGRPNINSMLASSQIVNAYANEVLGASQGRTRWDFDEERPLRDARGYDMTRADADPSQLTDEDLGMANVVLPNGARFYVDHAHPEYATPEVTNPLDAVKWDKAGERIMETAARLAGDLPGGQHLQLYKNNTDNKGVSYGCHENYLMSRAVPFSAVVQALTPFFVTRQIYAGSGRVGLGADGHGRGFQLTQRADFFEEEVGLETTIKRPIINTRDEPHADPQFHRRLHVIVGDANISQFSTYLKMGTTALVLSALEAGDLDLDLMPNDPVRALHAVSHNVDLDLRIPLRDGRALTAIEIQWEYLAAIDKHVAARLGTQVDPQTGDVVAQWADVLGRLENDVDSLATRLDWVAKRKLLEGYRSRDGLDWSAPRLALVDLQYSDVRREKGLANRLEERGRLLRLVPDEAVVDALTLPPTDTRAYFRGSCIDRFGAHVAAASWDSVIFEVPGRKTLQRVPTSDPHRGTIDMVGELFDGAADVEALLSSLAAD